MKHKQGIVELPILTKKFGDCPDWVSFVGDLVVKHAGATPLKEVEANVNFIAEAFNVTNEMGKSPAQLAQENKALVELNKELLISLKLLTDCAKIYGAFADADDHNGIALKQAKETIAKIERINS